MLNRSTRGRRDERGQVLVLAIAFIAFFGFVTVAVLGYASATELQHVHTEVTASNDSLAEGGAAWAAADAKALAGSCTFPGGSGSLTMQGGAVVSYTVNRCLGKPGTGGGKPPGFYCEICLLNTGPTSNSIARVLSLTGSGSINIAGELDANGSICTQTASSRVTAGAINLLTGARNANNKKCTPPSPGACFCTPTPGYPYTSPITDPFAGTLPTPSVSGPAQSVSVGSSNTTTINSGVYNQISVTGAASVTLASGAYVVTGPITVANSGSITSNGAVVLYLACPSTTLPDYAPCASGQSGGSVTISGSAHLSVRAYTAASRSPYAGVSLFTDPKLADPSGGDVITLGASGESLSGSLDVPSGSVLVTGAGALDIGGRLVAADLTNGGSGNANFTGSFTVPPSCPVTDDSVTGASGSASNTGRVIVQSGCNGHDGIVDFNYLP
jgi:hypothetical protein